MRKKYWKSRTNGKFREELTDFYCEVVGLWGEVDEKEH
jgi:hypothetical protein